MWEVYSEKYPQITVRNLCPHKAIEKACAAIDMTFEKVSPFSLRDLQSHQFKPAFGKILEFQFFCLVEGSFFQIGIYPEDLPEIAKENFQKIQFRKYAELWEKFLNSGHFHRTQNWRQYYE